MSTTNDRTRDRRRPRTAPGRPLGRALALVVGLLVPGLLALPASAYWSGEGAGGTSTRTGSLAAPTAVTVPAKAVAEVTVSWAPGTGGVEPEGYLVTRSAGAGAVPACGSSPTALLSKTSCLDEQVPDGDHTYVVTAVFASWTASAASSVVAVTNAAALAFATEPADAMLGEALSPVVVRLLSAAGEPVAAAGVPVTLSVGSNPGNGSLSGTTTVVTAADGTATFADLNLDRAGVGYTLVAKSPDLTSTTSNPFAIQRPPPLGDATSYSVLGGTGVVNTLSTTVSGDLGTGAGYDASGFPPGLVGGDTHFGDADAQNAFADMAQAYTALMALEPTSEVSGNLGGLTFGPGVHHSTAALAITGTVTLSGGPRDVFVFQVDAAFNTAAGDRVLLVNGAVAANVYWVVDGAAGLGAGTRFQGGILAHGAATLGLDTELIGRVLATGTVTMHDATIRFTTALAPALTITGGDTVVTKDTTPTVTGTSGAPTGTTVKVTIAGQTLTTTVRLDGTLAVTAASLPAGTYSVVAQVRDAAGNATKAWQSVVVEVNPKPVPLGSARSFSVLSGATGPAVSNAGFTVVSGDVGSSPGTVAGFPDGTAAGAIHSGDQVAAAATSDLLGAIDDATGRTPHTQFAGDLGGRTFHVGVHRSLAAVGVTGTVILDGENDPDAVFIFRINGALTAAASCRVQLVNGAQAANVFWLVDGAAGTGASCTFAGNLLARGAVTLGASTSLEGRALSLAAITLSTNTITGASPAGNAVFAGRSAPSTEESPPEQPVASSDPTPSEEAGPTSEPAPDANPDPPPSPATDPDPSLSVSAAPDVSPPPSEGSSPPAEQPSADSPSPTPQAFS